MRKTIGSVVWVLVGLLGLVFAQGAGAATYYVNQSDLDAYDTVVFPVFADNLCQDPNVPCRTILHAEDHADDAAGNTVAVLADPGGQADVYEGPVEVGNGATGVTLTGAGSGAGGTVVAAISGQVVRLVGDSHVSDLATTLGGASGLALGVFGTGSLAERIVANAPNGQALAISQSARDVVASGKYGGFVDGTLTRATITASDVGLDLGNAPTPARLLDTVIRGQGSPSVGLRVPPSGTAQFGDARHVTVVGFTNSALVTGTALQGRLRAANSIFSGPDPFLSSDIKLDGPQASAELTRTSVGSKAFAGGAGAAQLSETEAVHGDPGVDVSGHLIAGSALVDRGTSGGVLSGLPEDALDVDGEARTLGAAPDVGADETAPASPAAGGTPSAGGSAVVQPGSAQTSAAVAADLAPVLSRLTITPTKVRRGKRATISFRLSEPATVSVTFAKRVKRRVARRTCHGSVASKTRRRGKRCTLLVPLAGALTTNGQTGQNALTFSGKLGGKTLKPGSYAVTALATDTGGNPSTPLTAGLKIKKPARRTRRR